MRNRAKCKNCGDVIESKGVRDWVCCSCFNETLGTGIYVDGGTVLPRGGGNLDHYSGVHPVDTPSKRMPQ